MHEARARQMSLLEQVQPHQPIPKELEKEALELLVELFVSMIPIIEGENSDEQDHS